MMKLAFYRGRAGNWADRLICWWTRGPYSHVELVLEEYGDGSVLCASSSPRDNGVRFKRMRLKPDHWDLIPIDGDKEQARRWFMQHLGEPYDWLGVLGTAFRRGAYRRRRYICSEACAAAGLKMPEAWRFNPNDLAVIVGVLCSKQS